MKKLLTPIIAIILIVSMCPYAFAAEQGTEVFYQEIDLGNGIVIIDRITEYTNARAAGKTATRTKEIRENGILIGAITLFGEFRYDGTSATVFYKAVTRTDTYEGWSYRQNSLTSSGGTITLDAKLTKLFYQNIPFTISLTCDANGNIS